jgi:glycosyltransferase involved in cell wall biosynthesis
VEWKKLLGTEEGTLSVIIPTWSGKTSDIDQAWSPPYGGDRGLADMAYALCERVRSECEELIVTEDSDVYDERLHKISDIYMMHPNLGFTANVNLGLRVAHGDYMAIINSDVQDIEGSLKDLCVPGKVTSPLVRHMAYLPYHMGMFWVIPRAVLENPKYGYLRGGRDLDSDSDYGVRSRDIFEHIPSVKITHTGSSQSYKVKNRRDRQERYVEQL